MSRIIRDMTRERPSAVWQTMVAAWQWLAARIRNRRTRPPMAGVREPRRPKPTLPAAAVALEEPRTAVKRRIRLNKRHPGDRM